MGLDSLIRREAIVAVGGVEYVCRPPTLATVHRALALYYREVREVLALGTLGEPHGVALVLLLSREAEAAEVLATCVRPRPAREALETCAVAVLGLFDLVLVSREVARDMRHKGEAPKGDPGVTLAVELARRFRVLPFEVVNEWPYEAVIDIAGALGDGKPGRTEPGDTVKAAPGAKLHQGIGGEAVRKRPLLN